VTQDRWHQLIVHVRSRPLRADTGQTSGMTRREAPAGLRGTQCGRLWWPQTASSDRSAIGKVGSAPC